jgi:MYXO-CTERM domain-containing protein
VDGGTGSCDCGIARQPGPAREAWLGAGLAFALAWTRRRRRKA